MLVGDIGHRAKELIQEICRDNGAEIIRGKVVCDHVDIYICIGPAISEHQQTGSVS